MVVDIAKFHTGVNIHTGCTTEDVLDLIDELDGYEIRYDCYGLKEPPKKWTREDAEEKLWCGEDTGHSYRVIVYHETTSPEIEIRCRKDD